MANGLERRGWTVHRARDEGKLGVADREQLAFATEHDWVLLTFDDDFISLVETEGMDHAGLLYVEQAGKGIGDVVKAVDGFLDDATKIERAVHYI